MTCPWRHSDGAYVLGALGPAERSHFEEHLAACGECAAAVQQLAPLPGLLGRVEPAQLWEASPQQGSRLPRLLTAVAQHRRQQSRVRGWRFAVAATAMAIMAAAGGVAVAGGLGPGAPPAAVEMVPVIEQTAVSAEVRLVGELAGTQVWMQCEYGEPAEPYDPSGFRVFRLVAIGTDGEHEQLGSWRARPGDRVELTGMTRLDDRELSRIELQDAEGAPLLSYQP